MLDAISAIPAVSAVGWAVLHFLWQGCVLAGLAALALSGLRERSAQARYVVGCVALACSLLTFAMTFAVALPVEGTPTRTSLTVLPFVGSPTSAAGIDAVVPVIAWLWCVGAFLMTARFSVRWMAVHRIKCDATADVDDHARRLFGTLCKELGVRRVVRFLRSRLAEAPMVVGWLSPVVVIPVSAFTSLPPDQLRAVLAHELAHIRRYDYLVNGIQSIIEVVLFFHPAVWWLSGQVRREREQCCDDIAVHTAGNAMVYAKALSRLEALRDEHTQIALAANGGILMQRIERIIGIDTNARSMANGWRIATGLTVALALVAVGIVHAAASDDDAKQDSNPKAQAKDAPDPVTQALKAAVRNGSMSEERAIQVYSLLTEGPPGSNREAKTEAYLEQAAAKLDAMVMTGELSAEDAEAKMIAIEEQVAFKEEQAFKMETGDGSETEAYLEQVAAKLDAMVSTGELSAEDAEAKMIAIEKRIAIKEELAARLNIDGKSKTEAYLELVAAELDTLVRTGELSAEDAQARMSAIEQAVTVEAQPGSLDARTVLRAAKRVDLNRAQRDEIRAIERETIGAYRNISRKDKQRHNELAERVKAQISALLNGAQITQFESALERLDRGSRRARSERSPSASD